jgi:hypothetical protein
LSADWKATLNPMLRKPKRSGVSLTKIRRLRQGVTVPGMAGMIILPRWSVCGMHLS